MWKLVISQTGGIPKVIEGMATKCSDGNLVILGDESSYIRKW
mgnify:FL=1|jgi:hypothetical protein